MAGRRNVFPSTLQMLSILYLLYLVREIKVSENVLSVVMWMYRISRLVSSHVSLITIRHNSYYHSQYNPESSIPNIIRFASVLCDQHSFH